jgi:hypothetical protein
MATKIDVSKYDLINFATAHQTSMKSESEFYRSGNYLLFIKHRCLSLFLMNSQFSFYHRHDSSFAEAKQFSCYQFPNGGREHDFQAFKKLNLVDRIPDFNNCHSVFYLLVISIWEQIQSFMTEHHNRWKLLPAYEKVNLLDKLHSLYKGRDNSEIYNQYFIYENQYLHQQFDRLISTKDFNDWWEGNALNVLK